MAATVPAYELEDDYGAGLPVGWLPGIVYTPTGLVCVCSSRDRAPVPAGRVCAAAARAAAARVYVCVQQQRQSPG